MPALHVPTAECLSDPPASVLSPVVVVLQGEPGSLIEIGQLVRRVTIEPWPPLWQGATASLWA
jgi:hypothetical protein